MMPAAFNLLNLLAYQAAPSLGRHGSRLPPTRKSFGAMVLNAAWSGLTLVIGNELR